MISAIIQPPLDWGRENDCPVAELSVLPANPARHLYESIGFTMFNVDMTLPLR